MQCRQVPIISVYIFKNLYPIKNSSNKLIKYFFIFFTEDIVPKNPCDPSPCGPNSVCQVRGESPACSCIENYVGMPPNCRPECTINPECSNKRACINQKCKDPCPGSCGSNAVCSVVNHNALCTCLPGYIGDPFQACILQPGRIYCFNS